MIIAVDFDGTCVTHEYPRVGQDIGAQKVLKELINSGHKLILITMREYGHGLEDAVEWFSKNNIPLVSVNESITSWAIKNGCRKVYANMYIDDLGLGIPLKQIGDYLPFVDWIEARKILVSRGLIHE